MVMRSNVASRYKSKCSHFQTANAASSGISRFRLFFFCRISPAFSPFVSVLYISLLSLKFIQFHASPCGATIGFFAHMQKYTFHFYLVLLSLGSVLTHHLRTQDRLVLILPLPAQPRNTEEFNLGIMRKPTGSVLGHEMQLSVQWSPSYYRDFHQTLADCSLHHTLCHSPSDCVLTCSTYQVQNPFRSCPIHQFCL